MYDYICPRCDSGRGKISFQEIQEIFGGGSIVFHCIICREDFITEDRESGYLWQKIENLRQRYPGRIFEELQYKLGR